MATIRVLVVDDSVVIRKVLTEALAVDPGIEVVGTAADGAIALAKIPILEPDLITLDVEMPGKSGLEVLAEIRRTCPKLPVIMFSTLTERGAATTIEALSLGASDYVTKPHSTGSVEQTRARIQFELIPKVKGLCQRETWPTASTLALVPAKALPAVNESHRRVDVVTIGSSTGGPNALAAILPLLKRDFPVPIVMVVSYADFITLLFAFFVVLYSSSPVDKRKVGRLALAIQVAFRELGVFETSNTKIPLSSTEPMPFATVQTVENARRSGHMQRFVQPAKGVLTVSASSGFFERYSGSTGESPGSRNSRAHGFRASSQTRRVVSLREMGFYDSGSALIRPSAIGAVDRLASVVAPRGESLRIEGHTDNVPIHTAQFPSNWELSTTRASNLVGIFINRYHNFCRGLRATLVLRIQLWGFRETSEE